MQVWTWFFQNVLSVFSETRCDNFVIKTISKDSVRARKQVLQKVVVAKRRSRVYTLLSTEMRVGAGKRAGTLPTTVPDHGGQQSYALVRWGWDSHNSLWSAPKSCLKASERQEYCLF